MSATHATPMEASNKHLWYLSYGSNMNPQVLTDRRKIYPLQSLPCRVPNYCLNFNCQGIPYIEPSFASIHRISSSSSSSNPTPELHGVIHLITRAEMWAIRLSEGGNGHDGLGYNLQEVEVITYTGHKIVATTLVYHTDEWDAHPSSRYMNLILHGAKISQLHPTYQQYLSTLPIYQRKSFFQTMGFLCVGGVAAFLFFPVILILGGYRLWTNKRPPRMLIFLMNTARQFIYLLHDIILEPFLGSGYKSTT